MFSQNNILKLNDLHFHFIMMNYVTYGIYDKEQKQNRFFFLYSYFYLRAILFC